VESNSNFPKPKAKANPREKTSDVKWRAKKTHTLAPEKK
jgi:hypothetical protein